MSNIRIEHCGFSYSGAQTPALFDITQDFPEGTMWVIAGSNGSGKTTLLKLISGILLNHYTGSIVASGEDIKSFSRKTLAGQFAYVGGGTSSRIPLTVEELLIQGRYPFSSGFWREVSAEDHNWVKRVLELLELTRKKDRLISSLSWGESALAMIGRAIVQSPRWIFLDEAISGLDFGIQKKIFSVLEVLRKERQMGALLIGHDLNTLMEFVSNMVWLHKGKILASGEASTVVTKELLAEVYGEQIKFFIGRNPASGRPKIFYM